MSPPQGKEPPQGDQPPQGKKKPQRKKKPQGKKNRQGDERLEYNFNLNMSFSAAGHSRVKRKLQNFCRVVTSGKGLPILCVIAALMVCFGAYVLRDYDVGKALSFIANLAKIIAL